MFSDDNDMTTDAWSGRVKPIDHRSIVARTLLSPTPVPTEKKKGNHATAAAAPVVPTSGQSATDPIEMDYGDSYPNTNTTKVDWALLAAHRVANILGIKVHDGKKAATVEKNIATIFFAKCNGEKFKDDQRFKLIERLTLESILLAIFLPLELPAHFQSLALQHNSLKLAARQCTAQIEHNRQILLNRGSHERDLLIKRILFHADNGKTDCSFVIDVKDFNQHGCCWSEQTLDSVREPDLFGRAIGVLVHDVLQSPSLRVKAGSLEKQQISLILSWARALENIKEDPAEEQHRREKQVPPAPPPQHNIPTATGQGTATFSSKPLPIDTRLSSVTSSVTATAPTLSPATTSTTDTSAPKKQSVAHPLDEDGPTFF